MSDWISRVASRVDDQWCDKCQRVCCDCHISHRAELAQAQERIAELEAAIDAALDAANGRWSEWGGRAISVAEILEKAKGQR